MLGRALGVVSKRIRAWSYLFNGQEIIKNGFEKVT